MKKLLITETCYSVLLKIINFRNVSYFLARIDRQNTDKAPEQWQNPIFEHIGNLQKFGLQWMVSS